MSAPRGAGLLSKLVHGLMARTRAENRAGFVAGKDHLGNTYYESPADPSRGIRKPKRWFVGVDEDSWSNPMPAEWEAWLRYRRDQAPTPDEVFANMQLAEQRAKAGEEASQRLSTKAPSKSDSIFERYPRHQDYKSSPLAQAERVREAMQSSRDKER